MDQTTHLKKKLNKNEKNLQKNKDAKRKKVPKKKKKKALKIRGKMEINVLRKYRTGIMSIVKMKIQVLRNSNYVDT
jgi:hypothetical protein